MYQQYGMFIDGAWRSGAAGETAAVIDPDTVKAKITDAKGHSARYTVNKWGQPLVITDSLGTTTITRTGIFATSVTGPTGRTDHYTYTGPFVTEIRLEGRKPQYLRYGAYGQVDSTWGPGRVPQRFFLGTGGRVDSVRFAGSSVTRYTYDSKGRVLTVKDPQNHLTKDTTRLHWKGLIWEGDSTKLYYVRNRWYDATIGRFVSEDPIGLSGGLNKYTFGYQEPIRNRDPMGLAVSCVDFRDLWTNQKCVWTKDSQHKDNTPLGTWVQQMRDSIPEFADAYDAAAADNSVLVSMQLSHNVFQTALGGTRVEDLRTFFGVETIDEARGRERLASSYDQQMGVVITLHSQAIGREYRGQIAFNQNAFSHFAQRTLMHELYGHVYGELMKGPHPGGDHTPSTREAERIFDERMPLRP